MSNKACARWLDSLIWQTDFYLYLGRRRRTDPELDRRDYERSRSGKLGRTRCEVKQLMFRFAASNIISSVRPRLAISGYHNPEDLWELPKKIKDLNPRYKMALGHHSPIMWESAFDAWETSKETAPP